MSMLAPTLQSFFTERLVRQHLRVLAHPGQDGRLEEVPAVEPVVAPAPGQDLGPLPGWVSRSPCGGVCRAGARAWWSSCGR